MKLKNQHVVLWLTIKILAIILLISILIAVKSNAQTVYENGNITKDTISLNEAVITGSYIAKKTTPFSFTNVNKTEIDFRTNGTEPAVLLSHTPSITYHSDNGLGTGYIYYRLRGIDQTRINSTLNGVPMNEPEDQGIYYNNYPDFLNSVGNVQIIRGAGLTKSGVSSYGGSINFQSGGFTDSTEIELQVLFGSYNTKQISAGGHTKNFYLQASKLSTDGYKNNAFNDSYSAFYGFSPAEEHTKNIITLHGFIGQQTNGMGWLGELEDSIQKNPRFNSNKHWETDYFTHVHNQLNYTRKGTGLSATLYHTFLDGWYDTDIAHFDSSLDWKNLISRITLFSNWIGLTINYNVKHNNLDVNYGTNISTYFRDHTGSDNGIQSYTNTGYRKEISPYFKAEYKTKKSTLYGDVQYRYSTFSYEGTNEFPTQKYSFINWSMGLTHRVGDNSQIYYALGKTNREPTRTDLFMGWDDYDPEFYNPTEPESVVDNELGFKYFGKRLILRGNLYNMNFTNEIVLNGQYGPNAILLHQNVAQSYRSGIEIDITYKMLNGFNILWVSNFSKNQISQDGTTFEPVLTPTVISNLDILYPTNWGYIGLNTRYNGESYIDFSNDNILPSYSTLNGYIGVTLKRFEIKAKLNNLTNELIYGNAVMGWDGEPLYFVMAGYNGMLTLKYKF